MIIHKCLVCGNVFKEEPYYGPEPEKIKISHGFCSEKCKAVYRQEMLEDLRQWREKNGKTKS